MYYNGLNENDPFLSQRYQNQFSTSLKFKILSLVASSESNYRRISNHPPIDSAFRLPIIDSKAKIMHSNQHQSEPHKPDSHSASYAPYPKLNPNDVAPPPPPPVGNWTYGVPEGPAPISGNSATAMPPESNPYVSPAPVPASSVKSESALWTDLIWLRGFVIWRIVHFLIFGVLCVFVR